MPVAPPGTVTRDLRGDGWHVQLDLAPQVLLLAIPDEITREKGEEALAPTAGRLSDGFISASMLAVNAKLFDDGLFAAAELAAQRRKVDLLASLVHVAPVIAAAARLGGLELPLSDESQRIRAAFVAAEQISKPLGFYTWNDALRRIFQQDRLLQQRLEPSDVQALTEALEAVPATKASYAEYLAFAARLTNPAHARTPALMQPGGAFFFPPSRSHESDLVGRLYHDRPIPAGFSLADEIIKRVRDGSLTLAPTEASGWYDLQVWALESLVLPDRMPEGARLRMNERYREQLDDLFKAILSLTRETHVKQLLVPTVGAAMGRGREAVVSVAPELTVEPLVTYYRRRAQGYAFVRHVLESLGPLNTMRRLTAQGPATRSLDEELADVTVLFEGAAAVAGQELGMHVATGADAERFREWASRHNADQDVRMMVPAFYDIGRRKTKVWAILGWATRLLKVSFAAPPTAYIVEGRPRIVFESAFRRIAYPVFAEAYVSRLLDRDEFRAHCDRYKTRAEILRHL